MNAYATNEEEIQDTEDKETSILHDSDHFEDLFLIVIGILLLISFWNVIRRIKFALSNRMKTS